MIAKSTSHKEYNTLNTVIARTCAEMPFTYKSNQLPVTGIQGFKNDLMVLFLLLQTPRITFIHETIYSQIDIDKIVPNRFFKWFRSIITVATMHGFQLESSLSIVLSN